MNMGLEQLHSHVMGDLDEWQCIPDNQAFSSKVACLYWIAAVTITSHQKKIASHISDEYPFGLKESSRVAYIEMGQQSLDQCEAIGISDIPLIFCHLLRMVITQLEDTQKTLKNSRFSSRRGRQPLAMAIFHAQVSGPHCHCSYM